VQSSKDMRHIMVVRRLRRRRGRRRRTAPFSLFLRGVLLFELLSSFLLLANNVVVVLVVVEEAAAYSFEVHERLGRYRVTPDRGFLLPTSDPLTELPTKKRQRRPLGQIEDFENNDADDVDAKIDGLFETWDSLTRQLPSLCGASDDLRGVVLSKLQPFHDDDGVREAAAPDRKNGDSTLYESAVRRLKQSSRPDAALERAHLCLSFLAHAYVWCCCNSNNNKFEDDNNYGDGDNTVHGDVVVSRLPAPIAVPWCLLAGALGRPPILTYYSYNACNWRRIDPARPIELGNICRLANFFGGQDEEWFSMVHVAIEAQAGRALASCVEAHCAVRRYQEEEQQLEGEGSSSNLGDLNRNRTIAATTSNEVRTSLRTLAEVIRDMSAILQRMEERADNYIYHHRVRIPMSGWTDPRIAERGGMVYEGVESTRGCGWRRESTYYGETGAQSSVIPAIDAALGLSCDASVKGNEYKDESSERFTTDAERASSLVPYLLAMRQYMPPKHALLIEDLQSEGMALREYVLAGKDSTEAEGLTLAFDGCVEALAEFRTLHLGLAYRFVRQWDERNDEEVIGTGGTAFMPYLRAHRDATKRHAVGREST